MGGAGQVTLFPTGGSDFHPFLLFGG